MALLGFTPHGALLMLYADTYGFTLTLVGRLEVSGGGYNIVCARMWSDRPVLGLRGAWAARPRVRTRARGVGTPRSAERHSMRLALS